MKHKLLIFLSFIIFIISLSACNTIQEYSSDENDSYHISSNNSGGSKDVSGRIKEIKAMNMLGNERIVISFIPDKENDEKLPYYELTFSDEDREDFTLTVFSAKADSNVITLNEGDYDLLESLDIFQSDGNIIIKAECDESLKFKIEENTDSMQIVLNIKEIKKEKKEKN